jgi:ABC-type nitrate/sulfonate/bicarbonate transport system permease component
MVGAASRHGEAWIRGLSLLGFFAVWQLAAVLLAQPLLPAPTVVITSLWSHVMEGGLLYHLGVTLARVAVSFFIALAIGAAIGILMGRSARVDGALDGVLVLGLNIPALVTIILCYIWFGLTETAAVIAVALNKIPTVVVTVREGARAVDPKLMEVARVYRVGPLRTLMRVYLPQLYPYLMIVLVVELLGRSSGVGFQIGTYFQFFDITSILAYTLAFAGVILIIEAGVVRPLERRFSRWRS